uniref:Uncharacterized protein n=1 Tax=Anas zonorhyncha TaxID=75864 RepID=A0A8B9ZYW3_9AVES
MRHFNDQLNLPPRNRPEITDRLLIRQSHRTGHRCRNNPNPLIILRGNNPNNLPRTNLLHTILPSQHKLRTHTQPNSTAHTRPPTPITTHSHLMITG